LPLHPVDPFIGFTPRLKKGIPGQRPAFTASGSHCPTNPSIFHIIPFAVITAQSSRIIQQHRPAKLFMPPPQGFVMVGTGGRRTDGGQHLINQPHGFEYRRTEGAEVPVTK